MTARRASERERGETERPVAFLRNLEERRITFSRSCGRKVFSCLQQNYFHFLFPQHLFVLLNIIQNDCPSVTDGDRSFCKDKNYPACFNISAEKAQNHLLHEKCSVSMIVIKSISIK